MAPHQRLLHTAIGIARDVASKSGITAGACGHLRERIAAQPFSLAAGRHATCASFHGKQGRAEAWATQPTTTDVLAGQTVLIASPILSVPSASTSVVGILSSTSLGAETIVNAARVDLVRAYAQRALLCICSKELPVCQAS